MENSNVIKHHNDVGQGTNVFTTPIKKFLRRGYFSPEPRTILYWVAYIRELSKEDQIGTRKNKVRPINEGTFNREESSDEEFSSYGQYWYDLLPPELSNELLAEYIADPRGTIASQRFTDAEIVELRQPQRILLFYFIRKLANYFVENRRIIGEVNTQISENIFRLYPKAAIPDRGYITVSSEENAFIEIDTGALMESIVEGEQITRIYETSSFLYSYPVVLDRLVLATPVEDPNQLVLQEQTLPLEEMIYPFRPLPTAPLDQYYKEFKPAIIISSALLCLREGKRTIHLLLEIAGSYQNNLQFMLTTGEGWTLLPTEYTTVELSEFMPGKLRVKIVLQPEAPPVTPMLDPSDEDQYLSNHSALKIQQIAQTDDGFWLSKIDLEVLVEGLFPEAIRNQEQVLNPEDDFQPFGVDAELQSAFTFTDRELTHPALKQITLNPQWVAVPGNLDTYYAAYDKKQAGFQAEICTGYVAPDSVSTVWSSNGIAQLFEGPITFKPTSVSASESTCTVWDSEELDPLNHSLFYQLELINQDFGQSAYPLLMTNYAIEYGVYSSRWLFKPARPLEVNQPYIPLWSGLSVNYSTEVVQWTIESSEQSIGVFKNEPLGYKKYEGEPLKQGVDKNGVLYFGFENLAKDNEANMLFHGDTGNPRSAEVSHTWWYLNNEEWVALTNFIVSDGSHGFIQTGIFSWAVPTDISNSNPMMPTGFYWLKLTIEPLWEDFYLPPCRFQKREYYKGLMSLNGVFTNALTIVRQEAELEESNNLSSLKAGSILTFVDSKLDFPISLPYTTFGQVAKESELDFWARAFNTVRNKGRMVQGQDYNEILLRKNRELALVKAIPRMPVRQFFSVVVIRRQAYDAIPYPLPEIFSSYDLERIRAQIIPLSSPFIGNVETPPGIQSPLDVKVINPCYTEIGFIVYAKFVAGSTPADNQVRMFEDLQSFVNPWRYTQNVSLQFGCWFDYASIISFVQNLPYVEVAYSIEMGVVENQELKLMDVGIFYEDEILVLNDPNMIVLDEIPDDPDCQGIGKMFIAEDFIVCNCSSDTTLSEAHDDQNNDEL